MRLASSVRGAGRRGFVLIAVVVVLAMLSLSAYTFTHWVTRELELTDLDSRRLQARYLAESGTSLVEAIAILKQRGLADVELADNSELFEGIVVEPPEAIESVQGPPGGGAEESYPRFSVLSTAAADERMLGPTPGEPLIRFGVEREAGRIHINFWFQTNPVALEECLLGLPKATPELVDAVLDWLDADSDKRANGAEAPEYEELEPPIACRNGPLVSLEELLLVKGMTAEILFGEDANQNGQLDPNEDDGGESLPWDDEDGVLSLGWISYLTLHSREDNRDSRGLARINLNDPDLGRLYGGVAGEFGEPLARLVIGYRLFGAAASSGMPLPVTPPPPSPVVASAPGGSRMGNGPGRGSPFARPDPPPLPPLPPLPSTQPSPPFSTPAPGGPGARPAGGPARLPDPPGGRNPGRPVGAASPVRATGDFFFASVLDLVDLSVRGAWENQPVALDSPYSSADPPTLTDFATIMDRMTVDSAEQFVGRLDLLSAPAEAMALLIELPEEKRRAIIDQRPRDAGASEGSSVSIRQPPSPTGTGGPASGARAVAPTETLFWLVTNGILTIAELRQIEERVTTRSPVIRFQSVGFFDDQTLSARVQVIMDRGAIPPKVLARRELDRWGSAFALEELGQGGEKKELPSLGVERAAR